MINLEDGSCLAGEDAPRKRDLETWMNAHQGYMIDDSIRKLDPFLSDSILAHAGPSGMGRGRLPVKPSTPATPGMSRMEEDESLGQHVVLNTPEITQVHHFSPVMQGFLLFKSYLMERCKKARKTFIFCLYPLINHQLALRQTK